MPYDVEDTEQRLVFAWPKVKVKGEIMLCNIVNVSPPKLLDVATFNFANALVR